MARKLWQSRMVVVAAPDYLARYGTPDTPADLDGHNRLGFGFSRLVDGWALLGDDGNPAMVKPRGNALVGDGEACG